MKGLTNFLILFLFLTSCKDKPVNPYENGFVGNWKFVSVTSSSGAVSTNPTATEIITNFKENNNTIGFQGGSLGSGTYSLSKNDGIAISIQRGDFGGWPNGAWLNLYLETMNKASAYQIKDDQIRIKTSDNRTIVLSKL